MTILRAPSTLRTALPVTAMALVAFVACAPGAAPPPVAGAGAHVDRDPVPMVTVAGGSFLMGSPDAIGERAEHPQHPVTVATFQLDQTLVTVSAYSACVGQGGCTAAGTEQRGTPGAGPEQNVFCTGAHPERGHDPITCVDWSQANAYCQWAGKRLPTEEEWERAARGPDDRVYPWGADAPANQVCWNRLRGDDFVHASGPCPVGAFPAGDAASGAHDMVGNVWVWTSSVWTPGYGQPADATARVVRGGGWRDANPSELRGANRNGSDLPDRVINLGFRCAR